MDHCFFRLDISVQEDGLSWNESSSQRSNCRCQSADAPWGTRQVLDSESDILPCVTPKRHISKLQDTSSDILGWQIWLGQSGAIQPPCLFFLLLMEWWTWWKQSAVEKSIKGDLRVIMKMRHHQCFCLLRQRNVNWKVNNCPLLCTVHTDWCSHSG